ncbi:MAG: efflux RND transporter periplasmic adaptor subunit [Phycisphaerales bacterium]|nr:MAG: efflux RND transporter periplasmic adaptor subunit [Phycisphaerales bacterium]
MTANSSSSSGGGGRKSLRIAGVIVVLVAIGLTVVWLKVVRGSEAAGTEMATFVAKRGPLTISVLESGTIKSREQVIIKNEVEGRTNIISLIQEGTHVKKGDLLVELDASTMDDDRIEQEIRTMNAEAAYINAEQTLEVVKNQAASDVNVAELTLEFTKEDLAQYKQGQYPNDETAAINAIEIAQERLTRDEETLKWSERLYAEKYISQTELQADRLTVSQAKNNLELAENDLKLLQEFTRKRQIKQLSSDVEQAEMALFRAKAKARADVVQAEAEFKASEQQFLQEKARLAKLMDQISKATIYAPADGMVIYATTARRGGWRDNREPLDEGVEVFERQELIYLPTADSAMAEVDIHEASLEKVRLGLPALITVDALPGQKFVGTVGRISPLPDPQSMWMNPDLKVYNSDVYLDRESADLRTGMSCKVEIIVAQYEDGIYVPVQAVIRVSGQPTVYVVKEDGTVEERSIEIGLDNNRMVRITDGLSEGEVVWLAPPLKSAAVEAGSDPNGGPDAAMQQINRKLEEANRAFSAPDGPGGLRPGPPGMPGQGQDRQGETPAQRQEVLKRFESADGPGGAPAGRARPQGRDVRPQGAGGGRGSRPQGPGGRQ